MSNKFLIYKVIMKLPCTWSAASISKIDKINQELTIAGAPKFNPNWPLHKDQHIPPNTEVITNYYNSYCHRRLKLIRKLLSRSISFQFNL